MQSPSIHSFSTRAIHGGHQTLASSNPMITPIYQSTTFAQKEVGENAQHTYSRASNPTVAALESAIAALEQTQHSVCFATGMSATTALLLALLGPGDEVVCSDVVYGGTSRLLREVLEPIGIKAAFVDTSKTMEVARALTARTKLVFLETPANPTLKLSDIAAISTLTRERNIPLAVDNTFLTPLLQDCTSLGADIVLYSTTKYFDGHNATVGGAICTNGEALADKLRDLRKTLGLNQKPFEAWLTLQGIQTLPLRIHRQCDSASELATWLADHPLVERVIYPNLPSHPQFELAQRQQETGGALIAFELRGGLASAKRFVSSLRLVTLAENLGSGQSIATHPASMTHSDIPDHEARTLGISPGLIRFSVGLESANDLRHDLAQSLESIGNYSREKGENCHD